MGKGKKGKKEAQQKEDVPSLSSVTISDAPSASTSAPMEQEGAREAAGGEPSAAAATPKSVPAEPVEEDEGGLGLGARKKRPQRKKKNPATIEAAAAHAPPKPVAPADTPAPVAPTAWGVKPSQPQQTAPSSFPATRPPPGFAVSQPSVPPGFPVSHTSPPASLAAGSVAGRGAGRGYEAAVPGPSRSTWTQQLPQAQPTYTPTQQPRSQRGAQGDAPARSVAQAALCRYQIPERVDGRSVASRPVQVLTNYLPMEIKPLKISRYDVSFKPDKPKKMIPKVYNLAKDKLFPKILIAFDQLKNCYALTPLPKVTDTERVGTTVQFLDTNGKNMTFEVSFKATGVVDLGTIINYIKTRGSSINPPTEAIQCIDVILRQGTLENYVKVGRQFFKRPNNPLDLGDGLEMWTGMFQSAIFTSRPFINVDVAHKGFPKQQNLVTALQKDFGLDVNTPVEKQRGRGVDGFMNFIKNLKVIANIGGGPSREFICNDLVKPPGQITFPKRNDEDPNKKPILMSVAEYFALKKQTIKYPNLNCMWVGPRDKCIYYPLECLEVSYGQSLCKQLNERQLGTMVREAATSPGERKRKIEEVIGHMDYSRNSYFKKFGLEISKDFYPIKAKVLLPPTIELGGGQSIQPRNGVWQGNKLLKAESLGSWAFLAVELDPHGCSGPQVIKTLIDTGTRMGMRIAEPMRTYYNVKAHELHRTFLEAQSRGITFIILIVPTRGKDYYHKVKKMAEREIGMLTQCIKEFTATKKMNEATARNILYKVNSKLMGINQALDNRSLPKCLQGGGVMVVGADVTHPSPDQTSVPSIAAVTASIDPKCYMYNIQLSVQTPKKEVIVEFENILLEHLQVYRERQGRLPRKVFVFRDGVSEGQFAQVMDSELQAVHSAYKRLAGPTAKVEVLFLLVQKRHHTRFFMPNSQYNVEPGTVVDSDIVHARELDFYLVSHQAIKGTARPTRYHAVCNDGNIPHDEVEQLTYYLCHLYSRCSRAVSYPTPTYYAHLACLRARSLTFDEKFNNADLERNPQRLRVMDKILATSRMFFV